jgi:hypothetical protein
MMRRTLGARPGWWAALVVAWALLPGTARAQYYPSGPPVATFGAPPGAGQGCASCGTGVGTTNGTKCCQICCPHYHHCAEAPVHICFHHKCAKPVCNPCDLPHFGHWQKCWTPWPYGPDWGHCVAQPPASQVVLNPAGHYIPGTAMPTPAVPQRPPSTDEETPIPRPSEGIRPPL